MLSIVVRKVTIRLQKVKMIPQKLEIIIRREVAKLTERLWLHTMLDHHLQYKGKEGPITCLLGIKRKCRGPWTVEGPEISTSIGRLRVKWVPVTMASSCGWRNSLQV
jgi:hypothetical protein